MSAKSDEVAPSEQATVSDQTVNGKDGEADDESSQQRQERREKAWQLEDEERERERQRVGQDEVDNNNMSGEFDC